MSHACGHDGHMAVSAGLAVILSKHRPEKGTVALLFQPAEETGEGAAAVMEHPSFSALSPDYIFGFHNIPGAPAGTVIVRDNIFAYASRGMHITFTGSPAHAADPDAGKNPTAAALEIAAALPLSATFPCRATVTYVRIGSPDMGRAPFDADIAVTLRAPQGSDLDRYGESLTALVSSTAAAAGLKVSISWSDIFPETINNQLCTDIIRQAAARSGLAIETPSEPFLWSEDFGYYSSKYRGALLGIGAGNTPPLHDENYTFPDAVIATALKLYMGIIQLIHNR
jgi:amidohydrolase